MKIDTESAFFASLADEATDYEWPTRADVFSATESIDEAGWVPHELADEWEYDEADDEYDEADDEYDEADDEYDEADDEYDEYPDSGEAGADEEGNGELWSDTEGWDETAWRADEFDESPTDHECTCSHPVALLESPDEEAPRGSARRKLGPCTPVQDDLKPAAAWPEMQKRFRHSCSLTTHRLDPKSAIDCVCAFGDPREVAIFAMARVVAAGPLAARLFAHFLGASGTEVTIDVADMIKRSSGVRTKIRQSVMRGGDTGTLRIEQSDFKNADLQFAYGAIDCVRWTAQKPVPKNWRRNPATSIQIEMLDYYEFHPARPGVSQCAHAACVELVARGTARNFWTSGSAVVTLGQLAVPPQHQSPRRPGRTGTSNTRAPTRCAGPRSGAVHRGGA